MMNRLVCVRIELVRADVLTFVPLFSHMCVFVPFPPFQRDALHHTFIDDWWRYARVCHRIGSCCRG